MKTLKFRPKYIPLILSGEKNSTWRIFDDKDLQTGDEIEFLDWETKEPFAHAILEDVRQTELRKLDENERLDHEEFADDEEMLAILSGYYKTEITLHMPVKVLRFKVVMKI
jgi:hypothetical protein